MCLQQFVGISNFRTEKTIKLYCKTPGKGALMIFSHGGVPLYGLYIDPFWKF